MLLRVVPLLSWNSWNYSSNNFGFPNFKWKTHLLSYSSSVFMNCYWKFQNEASLWIALFPLLLSPAPGKNSLLSSPIKRPTRSKSPPTILLYGWVTWTLKLPSNTQKVAILSLSLTAIYAMSILAILFQSQLILILPLGSSSVLNAVCCKICRGYLQIGAQQDPKSMNEL